MTGFPHAAYEKASLYFGDYISQAVEAAKSVDPDALDRAAALLLAAHEQGARLFSCGNGGSASIANHLQCDHLKGVRTGTDLRPKVVSLSNNIELISAIANDIGYEDVFVYQLESQAEPGDVLIAISSSGSSPNIIRVVRWAREHGLGTIVMTGFGGGAARDLAEVALHVDSTNYGVIEDAHQALMHVLAQYIRHSRMSDEDISSTTF